METANPMYAILKQGGHQYKVSPGEIIQVDPLAAEKGDEVTLDHVLMISHDGGVELGSPVVANAAVQAKVLRHGLGKKVIVFKFKRRKGFHKKQGHRQPFTEVMVTGISKNGAAL